MPRVRKPNAEVIEQDKQIVAGMAVAMGAIGVRHGSAELKLAAKLLDEFVDNPPPVVKPRVRKPKAASSEPLYQDRKSAAANDARELSHHSV